MPTCSKCKKEYACVCTHCGHDPAGPVGQVVAPCEPKCSATVYVQESQRSGGVAEIMTAVEEMNRMTQQVSYATSEQKRGGELVVQAMENISEIARDNLATVQEMSKATANLAQQAENLAQMVSVFKVQ